MIRHHKVVAALPTPLEADSVYYVRAGAGVDIYVTNSTGLIASYKPNYQAANVNLDALAGLTGAADRVPYFSGVGALSLANLTAFGRSLLALADDPAARALLKLAATDQPTFAGVLFNAFTKIYPESNGIKIQLGSTTAATGYITIKSTGELVLESAGMSVGGSLLPKTTTILLGSPALPWNIGYIKTLSMSGSINHAARVTLDSATTPGTVDLGATAVISNSVQITGTTNVASFGSTAPVGVIRIVRFAAALILVNSATLALPGGANITTAANDCGIFECLAAGNWRCVSWQRADGQSAVTFSGGTLKTAINNAPQVTIASAGAIDAAGAAANTIRITGTAYIGSLGNATSGSKRTLIFDGAATLAASTVMILPGAANLTAAIGDIAEFECEGAGAWRCTSYTRATGIPLFGALPVGSIQPWGVSRATIPAGWIARDGQVLNRADWPDLWALVSASAVTDAVWLASPYTSRGKYSSGDGSTTFRMPDDNAKHADGNTISAMVLRGDGKNSAGTPGLHQADQIQDFEVGLGSQMLRVIPGDIASGQGPAPTAIGGVARTALGSVTSSFNGKLSVMAAGSYGTLARAGSETRSANSTVTWCTVGAGKATNPGSVDVTALATTVSSLQAAQVFTKYYESPQTVWAVGGLLTFNPGFDPKLAQLECVVTTAQGNSVVGDRFDPSMFVNTNYQGAQIVSKSASAVNVRCGSSMVRIFAAISGDQLPPANCRIVMRCWG